MENTVITASQLLEHWQGHRRLTRRTIEAFPEKELFSYSVGGMRPFADLAMEMIGMAAPGAKGLATGEWKKLDELFHHEQKAVPRTKAALLQRWDEVTAEIDAWWARVTPQRFQEVDVAFGEYEGPLYSITLYWIDNEVHHRGQGYVYLRSLGIQPPHFWER
ncbi:DinB family protein [Chitinophaga sp. XS-30]|uniref:DinB family protein n=1 Tax=Chitinophaga sp. XS-30 TaxID=2604421 RepID=UPI0011DD34BF|nr:DinB family protein [Chitinophaga sp. XS-30]QEH39350.1 damage-inducible protein DinB [Chitinophaga sp. XS-30]